MLSAAVVALAVALAPLAIDTVRARRSARPIQVVASPGASRDSALGPACRPPDDTSAQFVSDTRHMAASTDSAWSATRTELQIPRVDSTAIVLVADDETCRQVLGAFVTTLSGWPSSLPGSLYVAKAGTVYVGMVPVPPDGSIWTYVVTSSRFNVLSAYAK